MLQLALQLQEMEKWRCWNEQILVKLKGDINKINPPRINAKKSTMSKANRLPI